LSKGNFFIFIVVLVKIINNILRILIQQLSFWFLKILKCIKLNIIKLIFTHNHPNYIYIPKLFSTLSFEVAIV
jgi:hypothetical protein